VLSTQSVLVYLSDDGSGDLLIVTQLGKTGPLGMGYGDTGYLRKKVQG